MRVEVVYALSGRQWVLPVELPAGAVLQAALEDPEVLRHLADELKRASVVGIWGRVAGRDAPLREGDRIEIYRALEADPKEARRRRAAKG